MEGGFFDELRQLEFFPGAHPDQKRLSNCMPVVTAPDQLPSSDHLNQGIYQDEESVDFSALLEAYNSSVPPTGTTASPSSVVPNIVPSVVSSSINPPLRQEPVTSNSTYQTFSNYLGSDISLTHSGNMYGTENYGSPMHGQVEMTPSPPSLTVDCIGVPATPSPHVVQINNTSTFTALRPAPGKAQRSGRINKKHTINKNTIEYRHKRDKNNVAVRKSREKSKYRVMDTEKRVKELEEENTHLQSKIALLTKELNVLKSLFTSAGVSQPPYHVKDEGVMRK